MAKRKKNVRKVVAEDEVSNDSASEKSNDQEEVDEYIVEKIVDKRTRGKVVEYLIKWQGYNSSDNTWEPMNNIKDTCGDAIDIYESKHGGKAKVADDQPVEDSEGEKTPKRKGRPSAASKESDVDEEDQRPKKKGRKEKDAPESDVELDSPTVKKSKSPMNKKDKLTSKATVSSAALEESDALLRDPKVTVESIVKIGRSTNAKYLIALVELDCKKTPVAVSWNVLKEYHPKVIIDHCERMIKFKD